MKVHFRLKCSGPALGRGSRRCPRWDRGHGDGGERRELLGGAQTPPGSSTLNSENREFKVK
uniref:Uncharacterized protein n=1 Tax=Cyanistes caeruleus TaxID=156563 RepID=A0A8C0V470_CYACU